MNDMNRRRYHGESDVALLQAFNAAAIAQSEGCGYVHPGDIPHRLFNGNKLFDPGEVLTIWEDQDGVAAWVLVGPRHRGFDAQVRPDQRGARFERQVLDYAANRTLALMRRHGIEGDRIFSEAHRCDTTRVELLTELGWVPDGKLPWVVNRALLVDLPEPVLPEGYSIRAVHGLEEAAAVAEVHAASFGSTWTPELYRKVMQSPGYAAEREFIVEAADGTFAAFTVTWHDPVNRTGLLEPVGTHADYRRQGLGKVLVLFAMRKMAAEGMKYATVVNEGTNEAARRLYKACGFKTWHLLDGFAKPVLLQSPDPP
jgi:ribosomal protein S18 acetylase RimI-like enzyme